LLQRLQQQVQLQATGSIKCTDQEGLQQQSTQQLLQACSVLLLQQLLQ
jgi:hypothetical protein